MGAPAALAAIPLLIGSAAGLLAGDLQTIPLVTAGAAAIALLGGVMSCIQRSSGECAVCVVIGSVLAGASLGGGAAARAYSPPLLAWFEAHRTGISAGPLVLEGILREDPAPTPIGVSLAIDVYRIGGAAPPGAPRRFGGVRLTVSGRLAMDRAGDWHAGQSLRMTAILREPSTYRNPGIPDDRRALARRGISLVGSIKSAALVEVVAPASVADEAAARCRASARTTLAAFVGRRSTQSSAIATAILIGDRTGLTREDERRLQEAGTYHVIAISGGNIAILTAILLVTLRALRVPARLAAGLAIVILLFYGRITGPAASVDRAIAAAVVYLAGHMLDQRGPPLNTLAVAAGLGVAVSPVAVFDPGFILSFGATLGILVFVPRLLGRTRGTGPITRVPTALFAATVAAEIALAPIGATLFSRITFAGLVLNFAAIPLMALVQAGSIVVLAAASLAERVADASGNLVHLAATGLIDSARLVDVVPWLSRAVSPPAWWVTTSYYAAIGAALTGGRAARVGMVVAAIAGVMMLFGVGMTARDRVTAPAAGSLRVVFLDVGQGDATFVRLPDGRTLLIDAGGLPSVPLQDSVGSAPSGFDIGERVVAPALRALGVRRLEALVLTHGDPDHIGGALSVIRTFRPRSVWEGVPVLPHAGLRALSGTAAAIGAEWRTVLAGDVVRAGGVDVRVLHPALPEWERQRVRNDDSVVLELRYGDVSVVLPGDVEKEGEFALVRQVRPARIVVLKAPHHGSASSSTPALLELLRPSAVIFSAGRANMFGHPSPAVVARYRALGSTMFSTAQDGAVILDTDGRVVEITGWSGRGAILER